MALSRNFLPRQKSLLSACKMVRLWLLTFVMVLSSVEGLSLGAKLSRDHDSIDGVSVGDSAEHHWPVLVTADGGVVHWVADEEHRLQLGQLRQFGDLVPLSDPVVSDVESVQLLAWGQTVELLDDVV